MSKPKPNHKVFKIPKYILYTGKLLQSFSPYRAMRFVFVLFKTPFKFKRPSREDKMYSESEKEMLLIPDLQKHIRVYSYGSAKKKILLIHGWAGRGTQLYKIAESFVEKGYMIISFDATAHGESEGKSSSMLEFISSIFEIERKYGPFDFAIGHSLGGMALLNSVKEGFGVKKIAIIGSGNSITAICKQFVSRLGLKQEVAVLLKDHMDKVLGQDAEDLSGYVAARSVKIATLVVHDTEDYDVPVNCAYDVRQNLVNSELMITEGLGHRRILSDAKVINRLIAFFEK